jgi:PAS domain-containing protein
MYANEVRLRSQTSGIYFPPNIAAGQAVCDESGKAAKMARRISNLTERKQAEFTLLPSKERFRHIFQHSGSGTGVVSPDFHFLQDNGAAGKTCQPWFADWKAPR